MSDTDANVGVTVPAVKHRINTMTLIPFAADDVLGANVQSLAVPVYEKSELSRPVKALLAENLTTRASLVDVEPVVLETVSGPEL
jgi:hypothetical protein